MATIVLGWLVPAHGVTVTGTLQLGIDGRPAAQVQVQLLTATGIVVDSTMTDAEGRYALTINTSASLSVDNQPASSYLLPPYPNPFNPSVQLPFMLHELGPMRLTIFNMSGQPVRTLIAGLEPAGAGQVTWHGRTDAGFGVASGVYLVQLRSSSGTESRKITLVDGPGSSAAPMSVVEPVHLTLKIGGLGIASDTWQANHEGDQGVHSLQPSRRVHSIPGFAAGYELAGVPAGPFPMGSSQEDDERPPRLVTLSSFMIGVQEVTVGAYAACVDAGVCNAPAQTDPCNDLTAADRQQHPVNCITWYDAAAFCSWTGLSLPTEAQWEKAARGTQGSTYPWGDRKPGGAGDCDRAVMMRAGLGLGCGHDGTAPVGERPAGRSVYGVDDLAGNVWEWTKDTYVSTAYERSSATDPWVDDENGSHRSVRGNSWYYSDPDRDLRASNRFAFAALRWWPYVGVRCVMSADEQANPRSDRLTDAQQHHLEVARRADGWLQRNETVRSLEGDTQPLRAVPADDEMVVIPAGAFLMGSAKGDQDELPLRFVHVDAFQLDRYEVTVGQYRHCVEAGVCRPPHHGAAAYRLTHEANYLNWDQPDRDAHPVNGVSWYDAHAYCGWASKRLPTEAEWERAARGDDGRSYPWGNEQATCERAIIDAGGDGCGHEMAWPVGSRPAGVSAYGIHDLAGNLWEWTADWYARDFYGRGQDENPVNLTEGEGLKVLRGGSMADQNPRIHRSANRLGYPPDQRYDYTIGFRCAATPEAQ